MYSRYRRTSNRPSRTRNTRTTRSSSRYNPYSSFMSWFYRIYGEEPLSSRTRSAARDLESHFSLPTPSAVAMDTRENNTENNTSGGGDTEECCDDKDKVMKATKEELYKVVHVTGVDLKIGENTKNHRTNDYDICEDRDDDYGNQQKAELVLRRGQTFEMNISFNREYKVDVDDVVLLFSIGKKPVSHKRTLVRIPMKETVGPSSNDPSAWRAQMISQSGNDVTVRVHVAANCIIGEWDMSIQTILETESETEEEPRIYEYKFAQPITILLNPWCKDDTTYMSTTELLKEYVLEDNGFEYYGNHHQIGAMPWFFGQFEEGILEVSLSLLRHAFNYEITEKMSDPVRIARALSKMVNSSDEGGVLTGNWSGDYEGGSTPTSWNGSVAILKEYLATGKPVKFGQCWVFSGVLTAVCRAIGLPARSVTNFRSAHDTDESVAIDKHFRVNKEGVREYMKELNNDSIWNFHVWNEVWMARRDIGAGYDGWQALDATPQESSDGVYQCGPCPLTALKNGKILLPYDAPFIFAEVNAHIVEWELMNPSKKEWEVSEIDKEDVGRRISTKEPFTNNRMDVTHEYKYQDGSKKEMAVMKQVAEYLGDGARDYLCRKKDVTVELEERDNITIGKSFDVTAKLTNNTAEIRTINAYLVALVTTYTGTVKGTIKSEFIRGKEIAPGKNITVSMDVTFADYFHRMSGDGTMKVRVEISVKESRQSVMKEDDFRLRRPALDMETSNTNPLKVTMSFNNPLPIPLTKCIIKLDAKSVAGGTKTIVPKQKTVEPGEKFTETAELKLKKLGGKHIIGTFECQELSDISGYVYALVKK